MKRRLDVTLVERGLVMSRQKAAGHIMAGEVKVDGSVISKAGQMVSEEAEIEIVAQGIPYVSRGGLKLSAAIDHFGLNVRDKVAMDVGASTGGFTDCLLQSGASIVYAVDVGYGLIDSRLREDNRVILVERTNFRYIERGVVQGCVDLITIDVSFISVTKVFPKAFEFLCKGGEMLVLVKPQFEVGKGEVGKGGIVRDPDKRIKAVEKVASDFRNNGAEVFPPFESPVKGQKGNIEYFLYVRGGVNVR